MAEAEFDNLTHTLQNYSDFSKTLGGPVAEQAASFMIAVEQEKQFLSKALKQKKPSDDQFQTLLAPISTEMGKVGEIKEKNRANKEQANHLNAVAEAVNALGWVCVEPTPAPFVKESIGSAQFWSNKILQQYKGKDENQVNWVQSLIGFLTELEKYVRQYHTTGVAWNSGGAVAKPAAAATSSTGSAVADFDKLIDDHLKTFLDLSKKIGGQVAQQAELLHKAVLEERKLIEHASKTKPKPSADKLQELLGPISQLMGEVGEIKEKNRKDPMFDHLSAVAEGVSTLGWVAVDGTPGPFAKESAASAVFWTNKILKNYRGKDETHVQWVSALNGFLSGFEGYIKANHTTGLTWGSAGAGQAAPVAAGGTGGSAADFNALVEEHLSLYRDNSKKFGGPVAEQAELFLKAVELEKQVIAKAASEKKPSDDAFQALLGPISELMAKVAEVKDKNRANKQYWNHLSAVAEGVQVLGWVCIEPTPAPYVKDMIGGSEFWSNKILQEFKGKNEDQVNWVKGFNGFLKALPPYITQYHTTGLAWKK